MPLMYRYYTLYTYIIKLSRGPRCAAAHHHHIILLYVFKVIHTGVLYVLNLGLGILITITTTDIIRYVCICCTMIKIFPETEYYIGI